MISEIPLPPQWERLGEGSIRSAVDQATRRLSSDTPRLDAEVLMAFVLGWSRARLFAHWDEDLQPADRQRYAELVERRAAGEPVAYIRKLKEFMGLELFVDPRVLIPRPETELLASRAIAWLQAHPGATAVDVGTGSGAIAVAIARSGSRAIATDVSPGALEVARLNAARHGVAVELLEGSLLEPLAGAVDLIVANLPYLSLAAYEGLLGTSIAYEPRQALTDGADGLRWYDALLEQAPTRLVLGGVILLEIGSDQPAGLLELVARRLPGFRPAVYADYAGLPRVVELAA